ncbi:MAG: CsgG/HfaB family protein [Elusimicrobiota bacterium]
MNRVMLSVVLSFFVSSQVFAALPRIAVMKLENKTAYRGSLNDLEGGTADMLVTKLVETKKFKVIERAELDKVMEEQKLGLSGTITAQTAAAVGKILGVEYMIIGSVNEYGLKSSETSAFGVQVINHTASVGLDIRVINTTTAEITTAATGQCKKSTKAVGLSNRDLFPTDVKVGSPEFATSLIGQATRGAVEDAVEKITKNLGGRWRGAIIKVADGSVTINGGTNADIKVNDVFKVIRKGEEMKDPETGESLGGEDSEIGEIKITEVKEKYSKAKIVDGKDIKQNDKVEKK